MTPTASGIGYELSRTFSASPDALFDALTSAPVLKRMWGVQEIDVMRVSAQHDGRRWEAAFERDVLGDEVNRSLPGGARSYWWRDALGRPTQHWIGRDAKSFRTRRYRCDRQRSRCWCRSAGAPRARRRRMSRSIPRRRLG